MSTLKGLQILNTRPLGQNKSLTQMLEALGVSVIEWPVISIVPTNLSWISALPTTKNKIDFFIFTSASAVNYFFANASVSNGAIIAIGKATERALKLHGMHSIILPSCATSEGLLTIDCLKDINRCHIALIKGEGGRKLLREQLTLRGAIVTELKVYRRLFTDWPLESILILKQENAIDAIIYTSQEAIEYIFEQLKEIHDWLCQKPAVVLSQRLATILKKLGVQKTIVSDYDKLPEACSLLLKGIINE